MKSVVFIRRAVIYVSVVFASAFSFQAQAAVFHVAQAGQTPNENFDSWETAATNIADAVAKATTPGDIVLVSNGLYVVNSEIAITKGITVRSFNNGALDRDGTTVRGNYPDSLNPTNRCFYLNDAGAVVEGFTITNGVVSATDGGGVYIQNGTLRNCLVIGNVSTNNLLDGGGGGGVYLTGANSAVTNCDIIGNATYGGNYGSGGGGLKIVAEATAWNCLIEANGSAGFVPVGGDVDYASGGEVFMVNRRNIDSAGNLFNCTIISNTTDGYAGGGIWVRKGTATIRNCLVTGNERGQQPTGAGIATSGGTLIIENCTVVENLGTGIGGRRDSSIQLINTISFFNRDLALYNDASTVVASNCCLSATDNVDLGVDMITDSPVFQDHENGDFRLRSWSPGIDAGLVLPWMAAATDLDGNARVDRFGLVDMGCYEFQPVGTTIIIR